MFQVLVCSLVVLHHVLITLVASIYARDYPQAIPTIGCPWHWQGAVVFDKMAGYCGWARVCR